MKRFNREAVCCALVAGCVSPLLLSKHIQAEMEECVTVTVTVTVTHYGSRYR
jgi:hypothetical protein